MDLGHAGHWIRRQFDVDRTFSNVSSPIQELGFELGFVSGGYWMAAAAHRVDGSIGRGGRSHSDRVYVHLLIYGCKSSC